ncbi:hypothetical protein ABE41_007225 [Fictibacillus arsenicus]|jgi:hypothetical protein|uniref:Uncharacterized protein n=1 Tax=Fictibacillus arsenicus TaxID=255247 RepID=A0A1B1Z2S2_9BACL|nr:hypothetical protein [Fictibacillus arsenicus]ANX11795.1 hypothetical protein ABE41_007225 [Fictibacillus arsenicus]
MKKRLVLVFICGYLLLGPSAKVLSPTFNDKAVNLSHYTPISTTIVSENQVLYDKQNPLQ